MRKTRIYFTLIRLDFIWRNCTKWKEIKFIWHDTTTEILLLTEQLKTNWKNERENNYKKIIQSSKKDDIELLSSVPVWIVLKSSGSMVAIPPGLFGFLVSLFFEKTGISLREKGRFKCSDFGQGAKWDVIDLIDWTSQRWQQQQWNNNERWMEKAHTFPCVNKKRKRKKKKKGCGSTTDYFVRRQIGEVWIWKCGYSGRNKDRKELSYSWEMNQKLNDNGGGRTHVSF